jgi:hypothetical protein
VRKLQATIQLDYADEKTAEAVAKAVSPDNFKVPVGLQVSTFREDNKVLTKIDCSGKLSTFIATIDDFLFCVTTAERTLCAIRKMKNK